MRESTAFPQGISLKVNVIVQLEFELAYYNVAVQHVSHCSISLIIQTCVVCNNCQFYFDFFVSAVSFSKRFPCCSSFFLGLTAEVNVVSITGTYYPPLICDHLYSFVHKPLANIHRRQWMQFWSDNVERKDTGRIAEVEQQLVCSVFRWVIP